MEVEMDVSTACRRGEHPMILRPADQLEVVEQDERVLTVAHSSARLRRNAISRQECESTSSRQQKVHEDCANSGLHPRGLLTEFEVVGYPR